jgi:hypothetical protein
MAWIGQHRLGHVFAYDDAFTCRPLDAATPEGKIEPPPNAALRVETDHC